METCYNCGRCVTKGINLTREHIPAQGLFAGYGEEYKINRITVPACIDCNQKFSSADEEFRNLIGGISKKEQNKDIIAKTARCLTRNLSSNIPKIGFTDSGSATLSLDLQKIESFHIKNFKGIFYHQYCYTLPNNYTLMIHIYEDDDSEELKNMLGYFIENFNWKFSGHEDIFKYILQPVRFNWENTIEKLDLTPHIDEEIYGALMVYNKSHAALVIANRTL